MSKIHITDHDGKMEGIPSISTSVLLNPRCRKNACIIGSICSHCYAESLCKQRKGLAEAIAKNTPLLTEAILDVSELPDTTGNEIFRFESFGDLNNETQLVNYLNIVKKNPSTRFTLYTKAYDLVLDYFKRNVPPSNFTLIVSSLMVNVQMDVKPFMDLGVFAPGQVKIFTVYNKKYLKEHPEIVINCGSRNCMGCRECYDKTDTVYIREILKTDLKSILKMFSWKNKIYRKKMAEEIVNVDFNKLF